MSVQAMFYVKEINHRATNSADAVNDRVADREITPAEGRRMIRELKNPLEDFKIPDGSTPNQGTRTRTGRTWRRVE